MSKKKGPTYKDKTNFFDVLMRNVKTTLECLITNTKTFLLKLRELMTLRFCFFFTLTFGGIRIKSRQ